MNTPAIPTDPLDLLLGDMRRDPDDVRRLCELRDTCRREAARLRAALRSPVLIGPGEGFDREWPGDIK